MVKQRHGIGGVRLGGGRDGAAGRLQSALESDTGLTWTLSQRDYGRHLTFTAHTERRGELCVSVHLATWEGDLPSFAWMRSWVPRSCRVLVVLSERPPLADSTKVIASAPKRRTSPA